MSQDKNKEATEGHPGNKTWVLEFPMGKKKAAEPEPDPAKEEIFDQDYGDTSVDANDELDASDEEHDISSPPPAADPPENKPPPEVGEKIEGDPFGRLVKELAEEEDMVLDLANSSDLMTYNDLKADQRRSRGMIHIIESKPAIMPGGLRGFLYIIQLRVKRFQAKIVDSSSAIVASTKSDKTYATAENIQTLNDLAKLGQKSNSNLKDQP